MRALLDEAARRSPATTTCAASSGITCGGSGTRTCGRSGGVPARAWPSAPTAAASPRPATTGRSRSGTPATGQGARSSSRATPAGSVRGLQPRRRTPRLGRRRPDGAAVGRRTPARKPHARRAHRRRPARGLQPRRPPPRLGQRRQDGPALGRRHRQALPSSRAHGSASWAWPSAPTAAASPRRARTARSQLWDAATGQAARRPHAGHRRASSGVAFSPDGRRLATASCDETGARSGTPRPAGAARPQGPSGGSCAWRSAPTAADRLGQPGRTARALGRRHRRGSLTLLGIPTGSRVAFSPDGRRLASASRDRDGAGSGTPPPASNSPLQGHTDAVMAVAFSPDGRRLATAEL